MNFPYANGVIKAIEGNLFDKAKYAKLAKTDRKDFVPTLLGMGYGEGVADDTLERVIDSESQRVKARLDDLSPNRRYTDACYLIYDAMNLKLLYKELNFQVNRPDALSDAGAIRAKDLLTAVTEANGSAIPKEYRPLFESVDQVVRTIDNPRLLSAKIDACVFAFAMDAVRFAPGGTLLRYYRSFIDFANVITLVRSRVLGWDSPAFLRMLIPGGTVVSSVFEEAYLLEGEACAKHFQPYYAEAITKALRKYFENKNLDALERKFDGLLLELVGNDRNDGFGIGPILYYFLKKQAEAKNIRALYANGAAELSDLLEY